MKDPKDLHDKLQRRRRNAPRQPLRKIRINETDVALLHFIHLYGGMLSTDIIFEYAKLKGLYTGKRSMTYRLCDLYHDGYIDRPVQQRNIEYPERYNLVHRVSEKAEALLKDRGLYSPYAPRPYGAYEHQMMTACLYASYYIHALQSGFGFTGQHEILGKLKRNATIVVNEKNVTPDALFMLTIEGKEILIFLEADRATESGHSSDDKRKSWGRSIEEYKEIIGNKRYKEHYGVASTCGAQVHAVTISASMQLKIIRQIQRVIPEGCNYILTHATRAFGDNTHSPEFIPILHTEWDRWGAVPFQFLKV